MVLVNAATLVRIILLAEKQRQQQPSGPVLLDFFFECKSVGSAFAGPSDRRANQSAVRLFCLTSCSAPAGTRKNSTGHVTEATKSANRGARSEPASSSRRRDGEGPNTRKQGGGGHAASLDRGCLPPLQQVIDHVNDHADGWSGDDLKGLGGRRRAVWDSCPAVSTGAAGWQDRARSHLQRHHPSDWRLDGPHEYPSWLWPGAKQTSVFPPSAGLKRSPLFACFHWRVSFWQFNTSQLPTAAAEPVPFGPKLNETQIASAWMMPDWWAASWVPTPLETTGEPLGLFHLGAVSGWPMSPPPTHPDHSSRHQPASCSTAESGWAFSSCSQSESVNVPQQTASVSPESLLRLRLF